MLGTPGNNIEVTTKTCLFKWPKFVLHNRLVFCTPVFINIACIIAGELLLVFIIPIFHSSKDFPALFTDRYHFRVKVLHLMIVFIILSHEDSILHPFGLSDRTTTVTCTCCVFTDHFLVLFSLINFG